MSGADRDGVEAPVRVLVVCTGNLCRSPLYAALLRRHAAEAVVVTSRGTHAADGITPPRATLVAAARLGVDLEGHAPQQMGDVDVEAADLVLTATRRHRRDVVRRHPRAAARTFTLIEFARLSAALRDDLVSSAASRGATTRGATGARSADHATSFSLDLALRLRGTTTHPLEPRDDDVDDPMGRRAGVHRRVARQLDLAARDAAWLLARAVVRPTSGVTAAGPAPTAPAGSTVGTITSVRAGVLGLRGHRARRSDDRGVLLA